MKVVIIIPTYNERENIGDLIRALEHVFLEIPHKLDILVVDDNSPDGTAEIVKKEMNIYKNVHLLLGDKKGLGVAYIRGMGYSMSHLQADAVMEMDADFSHKPEDVPRLVAALDKADFVIGSRYIPGGKIPDNWSMHRKMNSRWGNTFARYVVGLIRVRDCTAGFRAIKTEILKQIDLTTLIAKGYFFQVNLLYKAAMSGARVVEIPVEFVDRDKGSSKLGFSDIVEFLTNIWWLRFERNEAFFKFLMVGALGVAVNLGSLSLLILFGLNKYIASPISIELSIISNFLFNNYWTFSKRKTGDRIRVKGLKFNIVSLLSLLISYSTFVFVSIVWSSAIPQLAQAIGIVPATLVNYFANSYWTFAEKASPDPSRPK